MFINFLKLGAKLHVRASFQVKKHHPKIQGGLHYGVGILSLWVAVEPSWLHRV